MKTYEQSDLREGYATGAIEAQQTLTDEVIGAVNELGSRAEEIASRLYSLKDRLFGQSNVAGSTGKDAPRPPANGFAEAFANRASDLRHTLVLIDQLSCELNSRL